MVSSVWAFSALLYTKTTARNYFSGFFYSSRPDDFLSVAATHQPRETRPIITRARATTAAMSSTPMLLDDAEGIRKHNPLIDALPYADVLPPDWRPLADRLVQEEMRRMTKRPKDYLAEMKPAYEMTYKDCPMIKKEMEEKRQARQKTVEAE